MDPSHTSATAVEWAKAIGPIIASLIAVFGVGLTIFFTLRKSSVDGCGTGRDASEFIKDGFIVTAFDVSPAMVRLCNRRIRELRTSACPEIALRAGESMCDEATFDEIHYRNEFDAVWASASLLHVRQAELPVTIQNLVRGLKPHGVMFASFKYGIGESQYDSRHYVNLRKRDLLRIAEQLRNIEVSSIWLSDKTGNQLSQLKAIWESGKIFFGRKSQCWINLILKKVV